MLRKLWSQARSKKGQSQRSIVAQTPMDGTVAATLNDSHPAHGGSGCAQ